MIPTPSLRGAAPRTAARARPRLIVAVLCAAAGSVAAATPPGAAASPPECSAPLTTRAMSECAHEDFLAASAQQAALLRRLQDRLPAARRPALMRSQKAWLAWRTPQCAFESSGAGDGTLRGVLLWQCTARLTRERSAALAALADCREGDAACARR